MSEDLETHVCRDGLAVDHMAVQRVSRSAIACFAERGYHATSMREIAAEAHIGVRALAAHFPTKSALLFEVVDATLASLLRRTEVMLAAAGTDPAARLDAAVYAHCDFYTDNADAGLVAVGELRGLDPEHRALIAARARRLDAVFADILADGVARGHFVVDDPFAVARAISTMCAAIPSWYVAGGMDVPRLVARTYCDLVARMSCPVPPRADAARTAARLTAVPTLLMA